MKININLNDGSVFTCSGDLSTLGDILVLANTYPGKLFKLPQGLFGDVVINSFNISSITLGDKTDGPDTPRRGRPPKVV